METQVTLFELLISCGGGIIGIVTAWIHMRISVSSLKMEMKYLRKEVEEEKDSNKENQREISTKIDSIFKILSEIKVSIAKEK